MPPNTNPSRRNQLGPVVAAQHRGVAALGGQAIQLTNQVIGGDGFSTSPPRHSRVCSSMMDTILIGRPSVVASN